MWDAQVGMRSTYLGDTPEDRKRFDGLLSEADVFFSNRHPGFLERHGLTAEELAAKRPGLVHAQVLLHGATGSGKTAPRATWGDAGSLQVLADHLGGVLPSGKQYGTNIGTSRHHCRHLARALFWRFYR